MLNSECPFGKYHVPEAGSGAQEVAGWVLSLPDAALLAAMLDAGKRHFARKEPEDRGCGITRSGSSEPGKALSARPLRRRRG